MELLDLSALPDNALHRVQSLCLLDIVALFAVHNRIVFSHNAILNSAVTIPEL